MSSDESVIEDLGSSNSDSNSEEDQDKSSTAKKLIHHKLPWQSVEFERVIASLDSTRSKAIYVWKLKMGGILHVRSQTIFLNGLLICSVNLNCDFDCVYIVYITWQTVHFYSTSV